MKYKSGIFIVVLSFALTTCFSAYTGDTGTLVIGFGSVPSSRVLVDTEKELPNIEHEVTLQGPGGTITKTLEGNSGLTIELAAGKWNVSIRGVGDTPDVYQWNNATGVEDPVFPDRMLRALGWNTVDIKAGQSNTASITMKTATEVTDWAQLKRAMDCMADGQKEFIVIAGEISAEEPLSIDLGKTITFMAEKDGKIIRGETNSSQIFQVNYASTLILGRSGMKGRLTIDGNGGSGGGSIVMMDNAGSSVFVLNDGVTLTNNNCYYPDGGGAVNVGADCKFFMNGGEIIGNSSSGPGGGVSCGTGSTFTMTGGKISNNSFWDYGSATGTHGGGVYMAGGSFTMSGGEISGNKAGTGNGGGVFYDAVTNSTASFIMTGGIIADNQADSGGGVFHNNGGLSITGGTIGPGNTADGYNGGGIYISSGMLGNREIGGSARVTGNKASAPDGLGGGVYVASTTLTMSGGSVTGNTAGIGGGVCVDNAAFTMTSGTIGGNNAVGGSGGGVLILASTSMGSFNKTGGTIYGSDAGDKANNCPGDGKAVMYMTYLYRNATAGPKVPLYVGYLAATLSPDSGETRDNWLPPFP